MDVEINDCIEIIAIIAHESLDIHWLWEEGLPREFSMPWFSLGNITY